MKRDVSGRAAAACGVLLAVIAALSAVQVAVRVDMVLVGAWMLAAPFTAAWVLLALYGLWTAAMGIRTLNLQRIANGTVLWLLAAFAAVVVGLGR